jgi:hypothetical protein
MSTTKQLHTVSRNATHHVSSQKGIDTWFNEQAIKFEKARFFWMALYITAQSCLGSVACGFILQNNANEFMLGACAAVTMGSNAVFIALGSPKLCLTVVYLSFILNTIFILINI